MDLFRVGGRNLFNVHAALGARDEREARGVAVEDHRKVELLLDRGAFLHEYLLHLLALGAGLVGHELHAKDLLGVRLHLIEALANFHAPALSAATSVNLGFHHRYGGA